MTSPFKGRLLVATPPLVDENFDRSVVLMLEHDERGALGVVLNRPGGVTVDEPLERWAEHLTDPPQYFVGGPVEPQSVIALGWLREGAQTEHLVPVIHGIGTVDLMADPLDVVGGVQALRLFHGYAGWSAGQLEGEVGVGAWIIADLEPSDAFTAEPRGLWRAVLKRQRGTTAWLANFPDDVSVN